MAEKKTTKATTAKAATEKKATATKKTAATKAAKVVIALNAENVGFKAGDVYQALAVAEKPLNVAEIAKGANISTEETLLGMGWLFKEGKILSAEDDKVTLA